LYFGLGLLSFGVSYEILVVFSAIIAILVARCHVFFVCGFTKYLPGSAAVPMNQQILMWFSGLRGAVAFALAVTFLEHPDFTNHIKESIFGTTVLVILFTVLGLGGLTPYMLRVLEIVKPRDNGEHGHDGLPTHIERDVQVEPDADQTISQDDLNQPIFGWLYRLDVK
jgi:solute carrier family 9 (sodium/hydrogen exchanger), member 8